MIRTALLLPLILLLSACSDAPRPTAEFFVFGTLVEIQVNDTDQAAAATAFAEISHRFRQLHNDWHAWEPGPLADINAALSQGKTVEAPAELVKLLQRCQQLELASEGYFSATLGTLVRIWGFHTSEYPVTTPAPKPDQVNAWLARPPSARQLIISGNNLKSTNPALQIDLGAIAKGYAVDLAHKILAQHGIQSALVNAGGDLRATTGTGAPWVIGIEDPAGGVLASVTIDADEAVFSSGGYYRYRLQEGERLPHILNPKTGKPATSLQAVSVIAEDSVLADAAATAIYAAGIENWYRVAQGMGLDRVMVIDSQGAIYLTEAMYGRTHWVSSVVPEITVVESL